jgi:glycosyltransferase involved in cell wall biosynthesis
MRRAVGWRDVQDMYALRDLVGRLRPFDVLHGHSSKAGALLRLAARGTGIPCVYTPHAFITLDPAIGFLKRIAYAHIERALGTLASQIVCVSTTEFAHARSLGIPASRLVVVPNGIAPLPPASRQAARLALGLPPHAMVIGTVGRLTHQKAMERLLKAFAMGPAALPDARLVIGGDGPAAAELRAQAEGLGVADRVLLPGQVDGAQAMAAFDVFALPSRYEAFPYVLLEAAARGLPVVMTDTGGAGEAVRDGYNGFVVPQEDAEAFSARLLELGREPTLRRRLGRQSHALSRRFTAERMVRDTLAVYEAVMPAGPAP